MGLLRLAAGLLGADAGGVGVVEVDFALGDAGFDVVELGVEDADLAEVTAFEGLELGAELGELGFALGERGADGGELLALVEEGEVVRGLLEDDFGWHADSRATSSLSRRHGIFWTHWLRHAGASKGSAKYWVSCTTLPLRNSMMLTVNAGRPW